jgi:DNA-binding GntR family transcriptional regulator
MLCMMLPVTRFDMAKSIPSKVGKVSPTAPRIDRDRFEPPYYQLANILRTKIATGSLRAGDRVPSELKLCKLYDVSPMTARRALMILQDEGLVTSARGRGTFVKALMLSTASFGLQALEELFDDKLTSVRFLSVRAIAATPRLSVRLGTPVGSWVIAIRRLLSQDNVAVAFHREYLIFDPTRPIVEAEMGITSLQGLFDGQGETLLKRGDLGLQATVLTEEEAGLLNAAVGSAAFRIEHTFYDFEERPISWGWFIVRADRLEFSATVGVQSPVT